MTKLESLLVLHEGLKLKPYHCPAGKLTIGVGRNLDDNPLCPQEITYLGRSDVRGGISESEALWLLNRELEIVERRLSAEIPFFHRLDGVRKAVLMDMAYNMGVSGLLKFQHALSAIGGSEWGTAAHELLDSRWATQVGKRSQRLAGMLRTGEWPADLPA